MSVACGQQLMTLYNCYHLISYCWKIKLTTSKSTGFSIEALSTITFSNIYRRGLALGVRTNFESFPYEIESRKVFKNYSSGNVNKYYNMK